MDAILYDKNVDKGQHLYMYQTRATNVSDTSIDQGRCKEIFAELSIVYCNPQVDHQRIEKCPVSRWTVLRYVRQEVQGQEGESRPGSTPGPGRRLVTRSAVDATEASESTSSVIVQEEKEEFWSLKVSQEELSKENY